jgi:hypothetical protein
MIEDELVVVGDRVKGDALLGPDILDGRKPS